MSRRALPNSSQLLYSWDPRSDGCLNATINCVAAMDYYCPLGGGENSSARAACTACGLSAVHKKALVAANCTEASIAQICSGNAGDSTSRRSGTLAPRNSNYDTDPDGTNDTTNVTDELHHARKENEALAERVRVLEEQMQRVLAIVRV
eukprot:COSAG02_NODE_5356_length_4402_cov_6.314897_3_plen_149_part_00